eukprot:7217253-Pyramimonas_sp.AAC.1
MSVRVPRLGPLLGPSWEPLWPSWKPLVLSRGPLGPLWALLEGYGGALGGLLGYVGAILEASGPSWRA